MSVNIGEVSIAGRTSYRICEYFGLLYASIWRGLGGRSESTLPWWKWRDAVSRSYFREEYGYMGLTTLLEHVSYRFPGTFEGILGGIKKSKPVKEFDEFTSGLVRLMEEDEGSYTIDRHRNALVQSIDKIGGIEEYKRLARDRNTAILGILGYLYPTSNSEEEVIEEFMRVEDRFFRRSIELYNEGVSGQARGRIGGVNILGCLAAPAAIIIVSIAGPIFIGYYLLANHLYKKKPGNHDANQRTKK